jgi:hypothetical protein
MSAIASHKQLTRHCNSVHANTTVVVFVLAQLHHPYATAVGNLPHVMSTMRCAPRLMDITSRDTIMPHASSQHPHSTCTALAAVSNKSLISAAVAAARRVASGLLLL